MPKKKNKAGSSGGNKNPPRVVAKEPLREIVIPINEDISETIQRIRTIFGEELGGNKKIKETYLMPATPLKVEDYDIVHFKFVDEEGNMLTKIQIRVHDLYAGGFANSAGVWFELWKHEPAVPNATISLSFEDNYDGMINILNKTYLSEILCKGKKVQTVKYAVRSLSKVKKENMNQKIIAESLLIIILNYCEGARFNTISSFPFCLPEEMNELNDWGPVHDEVTKNRPNWVDELVKHWGKLSEVVIKRNGLGFQDSTELDQIMSDHNLFVPILKDGESREFQLATAEDAEKELGIINTVEG